MPYQCAKCKRKWGYEELTQQLKYYKEDLDEDFKSFIEVHSKEFAEKVNDDGDDEDCTVFFPVTLPCLGETDNEQSEECDGNLDVTMYALVEIEVSNSGGIDKILASEYNVVEPTESSIETLTEEMNKTNMQPELKKFDCIEMKEDEIEEYILSHPHREANILAKIELLGSYDTLNSERDAKTIILQAIALAEKTIDVIMPVWTDTSIAQVIQDRVIEIPTIRVRVVLDSGTANNTSNFNLYPANRNVINIIRRIGKVSTSYVGTGAMIIDNELVLNGSYQYSYGDEDGYKDEYVNVMLCDVSQTYWNEKFDRLYF